MKRALLALLVVYRRAISPLLPVACRYTPTCSVYAAEAIRRHGAWRGAGLTAARLLRCRPGGGAGEDPVPPARARPPGLRPPRRRAGPA